MLRAFIPLALAFALLSGCASYQLGQPRPVEYQAIYVAPTLNQTVLPQLEAPVNHAVRQALARSGVFQLAGEDQGDARLEIRLVEATRQIAAAQSEDVGRARKIELAVAVAVDLQSQTQPDRYFFQDRTFVVTQSVYVDSGQVSAEYQASPQLAEQIAEQITELLADTW